MKRVVYLFFLIALGSFLALASEEARLLRFPDICGDRIVFVYAGDIWTVPAAGGLAHRLTSHSGMELFPKISPDGKWIAFSAEYSGSRQVWVMPTGGGIPRQLTYYNDVGIMPPRGGFDYVVLDWTSDSRQVLVRANRTPWGERMGKYFLVSLEGGLETPLQIPEGGSGRFSPDNDKIVYTPIEREFRNWKRYRGGRAQDVWIYDLKANTSRQITDWQGTDQHPIWYKDKIYFVSDRDLKLNIYSSDLKGGGVAQVTRHAEYDVLWPSGRGGQVVYENGGSIWCLDLEKGASRKVPVTLDFDQPGRVPYFKSVKEFIQSADLSPSGKRAIFEARGDLFTVPEKEGITQNLTRSQGVRELSPAWSPDGKTIAFYSDRSGEYEIYLMPADGSGSPRAITSGSHAWRLPAVWSPDGKKLLFSDKTETLRYIDVTSGKVVDVDHSYRESIDSYSWSPDSGWIVYDKDVENGHAAIWVYSLSEAKPHPLTDGTYSDFAPVFSRCGRYLFFISDRDFNLVRSSFESDYLYNQSARIYALALTADAPPLFKDKNDVEETKKPAEEKPAAEAKPGAPKPEPQKAPKPLQIDWANAAGRIAVVPLAAGNYNALGAVEGGILYHKDDELRLFKFEDRKDSLILKAVRGGRLSADGKKVLVRSGPGWSIIGLQPEQKPGEGALKLDDLVMKIDPPLEWQQIFNDGWRIFRDWFYVDNLHGVDWKKMRERYGQLVPFLGSRADLDFIFSEMVAEVNAGHTYVNWGDVPRVERVNTGLLGVELKPEAASGSAGRYRIAKIYAGENWNESTRSPLTEPGVAVREGDYLIALNGFDVTTADNPYRFLENTAEKRIPIKVAANPTGEGAREYLVKPIRSELGLFYLDWVRSRREMVDRLSGGRIGYIHVPDTSVSGNRELFKGMYAYFNKEALIIDERYNGGGFIPDVMADLLDRRVLNYWVRRSLEMGQYPGVVNEGPKAMLINGYSSSGGDAFPYYFRKMKLGTIIGTRTWGGLIGISGNPSFADGGSFNVPTFGFVDTEGNWAVEGEGVSPDITVIDRPELVAAGHDPCVERAVEVLLEQLKSNPPKKVKQPADPDRSGWIEKKIK